MSLIYLFHLQWCIHVLRGDVELKSDVMVMTISKMEVLMCSYHYSFHDLVKLSATEHEYAVLFRHCLRYNYVTLKFYTISCRFFLILYIFKKCSLNFICNRRYIAGLLPIRRKHKTIDQQILHNQSPFDRYLTSLDAIHIPKSITIHEFLTQFFLYWYQRVAF